MKLKIKKIKNPKPIFIVLIIILVILILACYYLVITKNKLKDKLTEEVNKIVEENQNAIFKVHKISLYSSANALSKTDTQALKNLGICQYTDIAIYLDNTSYIYDITNENTVKQLYIDNIQIHKNSDKGNSYINYKNALDFAKYKDIKEPDNSDRLDFNVISNNSDNENSDYSQPTFYTDCSNPITLEYMNKDIIDNYEVSPEANTVSYNGKVLQEAGIDLNDINYSLSFSINIINNLNEHFVYNLKLDVDLSDSDGGIYKGYKYDNTTLPESGYEFFKMVD